MFLVAGVLSLSSCSSEADEPYTREGDVRTDEVWRDGLQLTGEVRIYDGATVEIEPGAKISCTDTVQIQVGGALRVNSAGEHASISCSRWRGIIVAQGGRLDLTGLDIENAEVGIATTNGAGEANVTDSSILSAVHPFTVGPDSKLSLTRVKATTSTKLLDGETSVSEVHGTLIAKFLDYEANTNEGIMLRDGGEADIEDSTLKAKNGLDLVSSYGGKSLKLRYSTLRGAHCGPHLQGIGSFEIEYVTSEDNIYGITIYGASLEGPHVVRNSNISGAVAWLDMQGDHGPITFENVFTTGSEIIKNTDPPALQKADSRIESAGPREAR